jgi:glucose-1-phosphate thymidylyltransferase
MGRGMAWLDTGTFDSLQEAGAFIKTLENRQGLKIGSPEEVAWRNCWIDNDQLKKKANQYMKSGYGDYLFGLISSSNSNLFKKDFDIN